MLTVEQFARKLNVSRNTILRLIKDGKIKAIKVRDMYRIPEESYNQFITASEVKPDKQTHTKV